MSHMKHRSSCVLLVSLVDVHSVGFPLWDLQSCWTVWTLILCGRHWAARHQRWKVNQTQPVLETKTHRRLVHEAEISSLWLSECSGAHYCPQRPDRRSCDTVWAAIFSLFFNLTVIFSINHLSIWCQKMLNKCSSYLPEPTVTAWVSQSKTQNLFIYCEKWQRNPHIKKLEPESVWIRSCPTITTSLAALVGFNLSCSWCVFTPQEAALSLINI